jgi:hypothetical protein
MMKAHPKLSRDHKGAVAARILLAFSGSCGDELRLIPGNGGAGQLRRHDRPKDRHHSLRRSASCYWNPRLTRHPILGQIYEQLKGIPAPPGATIS